MKKQCGVTLVEIMVVVAILSILLAGIGPSAYTLYTKHRITASINELSALIQYARIQSIEQNNSAVLCPSHDFINCAEGDWRASSILFFDENGNGIRDELEPLIYTSQILQKQLMIDGPKRSVRFFEDGALGSPATFIVCKLDNDPRFSRAIIISLQGRVRLSQDSNDDGKHEKHDGSDLVC